MISDVCSYDPIWCTCKPNTTFPACAYSHEKWVYVSHICVSLSLKSQSIWPLWARVTVWIWFVKFRYLLFALCQVCWLLFFGRSTSALSLVISVLLTVGIGKLLLESHPGHKPHSRRGSEQQRALTRTCGCWLNEITRVRDEVFGKLGRDVPVGAGEALRCRCPCRLCFGAWISRVPAHVRLLMGLR